MLKKKSVYHCGSCGNIVEGLWNGTQAVSCCGSPMTELKENSVDAALEKHVPIITREGTVVTVSVGETPHPMTPAHYILFTELITGNTVLRHDFVEGDTVASVTFLVPEDATDLKARAYCNLHGLWVSA